jgi:hypothetical protein
VAVRGYLFGLALVIYLGGSPRLFLNGGSMKTITHWTIKATWSDGTEECLNDIPNYVANEVDAFLTELEEEANDESIDK